MPFHCVQDKNVMIHNIYVEVYLEEVINLYNHDSTFSFSIMELWKLCETKFPILSKMAPRILVISLTSVASQNYF